MAHGQEDGDSAQPLTIDSAASRFESLIPDEWLGQDDAPVTEPEASETPEDEEIDDEAPEATDDEGDEAEPSSEDESEETDEEPAEQTPQPRTHKVKVNGQELEVTEDELYQGYSRTADYTQKTQKVAEEKKALQERDTALNAERQQLATKLQQLDEALASLWQEPDWEAIRRDYPNEYSQVHANWQAQKQQLDGLRAQREAAQKQLLEKSQEAMKEFVTAEREKLLAAVPAWSDSAVAKKDLAQLFEYAQQNGFSEDELKTVVDHRAILMLRKAQAYDAAEKAKVEAAEKAQKKIAKVKTVTPGSPSAKPKVTELTRAKQRLAKTNRVEDAVKAYELMLGDDDL